MTEPKCDPRVFFAAERTLLAWLRTGLTVIGLGFVVSRFGLFVQMLTLQSHGSMSVSHTSFSGLLGIAFVALGSLSILIASVQHRRFIVTLPSIDLPNAYSKTFAVVLSSFIGALGLVLATYLFATQP